jgi:hypothetical protein
MRKPARRTLRVGQVTDFGAGAAHGNWKGSARILGVVWLTDFGRGEACEAAPDCAFGGSLRLVAERTAGDLALLGMFLARLRWLRRLARRGLLQTPERIGSQERLQLVGGRCRLQRLLAHWFPQNGGPPCSTTRIS